MWDDWDAGLSSPLAHSWLSFAQRRNPNGTSGSAEKMIVTVYTLTQGKKADTRLEISLRPSKQSKPIALFDCFGEALAPQSQAFLYLPRVGTLNGWADLKRQKVFVKIRPIADESWTFRLHVDMEFTDGLMVTMDPGETTLTQGKDSREVSFPVIGAKFEPNP